MKEAEVVRLNLDRFRRMLQTEPDEATRRTILSLIREFEAMVQKKAPGVDQQYFRK